MGAAPFILDTVIFEGEGLGDALFIAPIRFGLVGVFVSDVDLAFIVLSSLTVDEDGSIILLGNV